MLTGEHSHLYAELQRRMARGGDLSPGPADTVHQFSQGGRWNRQRRALQNAIVDRFKAEYADRPRGGHAVLLTAGAPGAGKSTAQSSLDAYRHEESELGRHLSAAHGLSVNDYVVLDPDEFKRALFEAGGLPRLRPEDLALPSGRTLAPAELSGLLHAEASDIRDQFEAWARAEGYNLLYDATLANEPVATALLYRLAQDGYDQRVILSVEVPLNVSLAQNADRWLKGRLAYERGEDPYGGRMSPEGMIRALYGKATTGSGRSIGRENAEKLAEAGLATGLITTDRGTFAPTVSAATGPYRAVTFQRGETTLGIAGAGRLRSPRAGTTPLTPSPQSPAPQAPDRTPPPAGRTR
ncbi:zeta toxin family protein [Streptomyces sp. NPDC090085]|uniref:zeta toxin family protein n=1 Tax=Streptomyces sp. NPDC090085 TaxID=3365943 RepID=UPI00380778A8